MALTEREEPTAIVYSDYDNIPAHPGNDWTRFVCMSDTHSRYNFVVPPGDILLHAGDMCSRGSTNDIAATMGWLGSMPHTAKIVIAGNHDHCLDKMHYRYNEAARSLVRGQEALEAGIFYLEYEAVEVTTVSGRRWKFFGSPAVPYHFPGAFQYSDPDVATEIYSRIPHDTEVLLTHTPPHMTLDFAAKGKHAGCPHLAARLRQLHRCRLHVFGHIHEARGATLTEIGEFQPDLGEQALRADVNGALYGNHKPIIVDLRN